MVISPLLITLLTKSHEPLSSENFRGLVPLQLFGSIGHGEGSADSQAKHCCDVGSLTLNPNTTS